MSKKSRKEDLRLKQQARKEEKRLEHRGPGFGEKYRINYSLMYNSLNNERNRFKSPDKADMKDYNLLRDYIRSLGF